MGSHPSEGVIPAGNYSEVGPWESIAFRFYQRHFRIIEVLEDPDCPVGFFTNASCQPADCFVRVAGQIPGKGPEFSFPVIIHILRNYCQRVIWSAVGQDNPVSVGDDTPCSQHFNKPDPVVISKSLVIVMLKYLKPPEVQGQEEKSGSDNTYQDHQLLFHPRQGDLWLGHQGSQDQLSR